MPRISLRTRRVAALGCVAAIVLLAVTITLVRDDGSATLATTFGQEPGTGDASDPRGSPPDVQEDEAGPAVAEAAPTPLTSSTAPNGPRPSADAGVSPPARVCENFVAEPSTGDDEAITDYDGVEREQDRYMADAQTAQAYGQDHPDDFVGVRFLNSGHVRLAIAFTRNLPVHCEKLRTILEHPQDFELWQLPWSERELRRVHDEINTAAGALSRGSAVGFGGPVEVHLRADGERLARELSERYGEMVGLQVGLHRYPRDRAANPSPACEAVPAQDGTTAGVEAALDLDDDEIVRGRDGTGTLTVTNRGIGTISVSMARTNGHVIVPGSDHPSAVRDSTADADVGYEDQELRTGESASIPVRFSTPACDLSHGYALRAGDYHVVTSVQIERGGKSTLVRSTPAPLRVHD